MPEVTAEGQEIAKPRRAPPSLPLIEDQPNPEFWNSTAADYAPQSTRDVVNATWESAWDSTALGTIADMRAIRTIDEMPGQRTLSIPELNQKYMGLGITWTEPKKEAVADYIAEAHQKRTMLQNRIALGEGGVVEGSLTFGATMARHLMDPVEMGFNILGGAAIRAASFAPAFLRGTTLGSTLARGAVEGAVTQIPLEALEVARNREMEMDVSLSQSLENVVMGGLYGSVFEGLGYAARAALNRAKGHFGSAAPREWDFAATEGAAAQMLDGKRPNIRPLQQVFDRERNSPGTRPDADFSGRSNYQFRDIDSGNASGKFYLGTTTRNADFMTMEHGQYKNSRTNFGNGIYGQDDAMRANGYAASSFNDAPGLIHEFQLGKAKLLFADEPLAGANLDSVSKAIADLKEFPEIKALFDEAQKGGPITARDIYEALNDAPGGAIDGFNRNLSQQGYDGVHFIDAAKDGTGKANGVMLFPESRGKAEPVSVIEPDQKYLAGLRQDELDDLITNHNSREQKLFQSREEDMRLDELSTRAETEPDLEPDIIDQYHADALETVKEMESSGLLKEDELKFVSEMKEKSSLGEKVVKAMYACVGKG